MQFAGARFAYISALARVQRVSMLTAGRLTSFYYAGLIIQCVTGIPPESVHKHLLPSIPARRGPDSSGTQRYRGRSIGDAIGYNSSTRGVRNSVRGT